MTIDYDFIKRTAKELGCKVDDLIALARKNDPFYVGAPAERAKGQWFTELWERHCDEIGVRSGIHLRRLHYWIVSQKTPILRADGKLYENTETCWNYLGEASKCARYLNLVDPAAFVDRRNPDAHIFTITEEADSTPGYETDDIDDPFEPPDSYWYVYDLPALPELEALDGLPALPGFEVNGYDGIQQYYHVEVWAEKTTQDDILIPLCRQYQVNLVTGAGELSITAVIEFLKRVREADRAARILYVSDYDPAGLGMPVSIARKIEHYQRKEGFDDLDIRLEPVILTAEQVAVYDLPRKPIKDSDMRKAEWEAQHGQGATELDALEANAPGELARIVRQAILDYYDSDLQKKAQEEKRKLEHTLEKERDEILENYQRKLDDIENDYDDLRKEFDETRKEFDDLVKDFQPKIDAHAEKLDDIKERFRSLYADVAYDLGEVELDAEKEHPLPAPELPEEREDLLYDSRRDYWQQLSYYKAHRGNGT